MRRILSLMAMTFLMSSANASSTYQNYADWGKLKLKGIQLVSSKTGDPVQLKGWSTQSLHSDAVNGCLGQGQWQLMQEYGANVVRLAMYVDAPNSYLSNPNKFQEMVKEAITETKDLNMYCVVDWHISETGESTGNPNKYKNEAKFFFSEISRYCFDNGYDHVLYEICNEPTCGWTEIKRYAEELIPQIAANQPDAIVIVGTDKWCQKIMEPVSNPLSDMWKYNWMYSFHYDACSHYSLLGDFRAAQKNIPVFVTEWSAVTFDGGKPFCEKNSDELISACDIQEGVAPQLVSWCVWNWGKNGDDASSFFSGSCAEGYEVNYTSLDAGSGYADYIRRLMTPSSCCPPPPCCYGPWSTLNTIPSTPNSLWRWDYYDRGGEGAAYHDLNSTAYKKDKDGIILDYSNKQEEVDVFSLAKQMQWIDKECPWTTVEDGRVVSWNDSINTYWQDDNGNPTYKSLNAGRYYHGEEESIRPDEGVDLYAASLKGTDYENMGYNTIGWIEEGEWIHYTVKVEKPGYYKIRGFVDAEYNGGEISITSKHGNLLRGTETPEPDVITSFGFPRTLKCSDPKISLSEPWNCWAEVDAISGDYEEVLCEFREAGEQEITISFRDNAGGVGPLIFDWYNDNIGLGVPICTCEDDDFPGGVDDVNATKFSINPNPTSGEFTVTLADNAEASVEVVNMAGQVVASRKIVGSASINKSLTAGVYMVVVKTNAGVNTQKLVVK